MRDWFIIIVNEGTIADDMNFSNLTEIPSCPVESLFFSDLINFDTSDSTLSDII